MNRHVDLSPTLVTLSRRRVQSLPRRVTVRGVTFALLLAAYVVLTFGVIYQSPLLRMDGDIVRMNLLHRWPAWQTFIHYYVMLGQRAPSTLVALPWFVWRVWKARSARPLVVLVTALFVLNLSVGVVKVTTGRLGPLRTPDVHEVFVGGNIFPSGHTANAVVLYGVMAMLVTRYRRTVITAAIFVATTVGLSTVYLDTHWLTDVIGGWLNGALVLLALPWLMPYADRMYDTIEPGLIRLWHRVRPSRRPVLVPSWPAGRSGEFRAVEPTAVQPEAVGPEPVEAGAVGPEALEPETVRAEAVEPARTPVRARVAGSRATTSARARR